MAACRGKRAPFLRCDLPVTIRVFRRVRGQHSLLPRTACLQSPFEKAAWISIGILEYPPIQHADAIALLQSGACHDVKPVSGEPLRVGSRDGLFAARILVKMAQESALPWKLAHRNRWRHRVDSNPPDSRQILFWNGARFRSIEEIGKGHDPNAPHHDRSL